MKPAIFITTILMCALTLLVWGQAGNQSTEQKIQIGTSEVQLDVIVKDKRGRILRDLKAEDFEILEDGVKQNVESFRLVNRATTESKPNVATSENKNNAGTVTPEKSGNTVTPVVRKIAPENAGVIALVFDRLSPDARKRARDAALTYLGEGATLTDYTGVFVISLNMATLQNYTTNSQLVRQAVDKASASATANFSGANNQTQLTQQATQARAAANSAASAASSAAGGLSAAAAAGSAAGAADVDAKFAEMQARTEETFTVMQRDQQGYATTNGLLAVVNSMKQLPGRKSIIYFSEGIAIPPNVRQHFRSVISNANRANVSVYAVDAAGLRINSPAQETRDEINSRSRQRMESLDRIHLGGAMMAALERNEDLLKSNPQSGLQDLALETGGTFIGDTNNMGGRLRQVEDDLHTYYLLNYVPTNQNYDGKFRNLTVRVNRKDVEIQTRKGYYAVVSTGTAPVLYYEGPALAILNAPTLPNAFPLQTLSMQFPENEHLGLTTISVQVPANAFTFVANNEVKDKPVFNADFSVLVLVKDQNKQVVEKLSYHYFLVGTLDQLEKVKEQKVLFYREVNLPPGSYVVEAIAHDTATNKASVRKRTIDVPDADETALRLSSVSIIQRADNLKPDDKITTPFRFGDLLIYPSFGEPIKRSVGKMGFYFNVYPARNSKNVPAITLEVLQNNKSVAAVPLKADTPDATGKISIASALPLDLLANGLHELKITVKDGPTSVSKSSYFTVAP